MQCLGEERRGLREELAVETTMRKGSAPTCPCASTSAVMISTACSHPELQIRLHPQLTPPQAAVTRSRRSAGGGGGGGGGGHLPGRGRSLERQPQHRHPGQPQR